MLFIDGDDVKEMSDNGMLFCQVSSNDIFVDIGRICNTEMSNRSPHGFGFTWSLAYRFPVC